MVTNTSNPDIHYFYFNCYSGHCYDNLVKSILNVDATGPETFSFTRDYMTWWADTNGQKSFFCSGLF